jgi:hypothetical protein
MNEHQQSNNELAHTLGRIEATLERFDQTLERFDHKLFGNGQPGEISRLDKQSDKLDGRLEILENFKSYIKGGFATLGAIVTLIGGTELYRIFSGH